MAIDFTKLTKLTDIEIDCDSFEYDPPEGVELPDGYGNPTGQASCKCEIYVNNTSRKQIAIRMTLIMDGPASVDRYTPSSALTINYGDKSYTSDTTNFSVVMSSDSLDSCTPDDIGNGFYKYISTQTEELSYEAFNPILEGDITFKLDVNSPSGDKSSSKTVYLAPLSTFTITVKNGSDWTQAKAVHAKDANGNWYPLKAASNNQ